MNRIAYVIPTKDRPEDLETMLSSVDRQTRLPEQVIVVDGSSEPVEHVVKRHTGLNVRYVRVFPPGLSKQRNAGMAQLEDNITIAGYLDDDVVLEPEATERIAAFWDSAGTDVGGAAFSIINQPIAKNPELARFFLLNTPEPGRMLPSGFQSQIPFVTSTVETDWLYGGATLWRREVIREYKYDEWYVGTGFLEDVDFSFRVRQKYRLFVVADARLNHYSRPVDLARNYTLGKHQIINRTYFVRKMKKFSRPAFCLAVAGQLAHNVGSSLVRRNSAGLRRAAGNVVGLVEILSGRLKQIEGHYK